MTQLRFVRVPGAELAYRDEGSGAPLLLVHAGVADLRMWDPLVAALGGRRRTLRPDLRGFGATRYEPGSFSVAADAVAVLDAADVDRAVAVGASFGGWVVLQAAARHPERFDRLVLLAPALPDFADPSPALRAFADAEEATLGRGDVEAATRLNVDMWAPGASPAVRELVLDMQARAFELQLAAEPEPEESAPPELARIAMPADVLVGERDVADFHAVARHLAGELPDARLHTVPGAGHLIALERPDAVAALL